MSKACNKPGDIREGVATMQAQARRRHAGTYPILLITTLYHVLHNIAARTYAATIKLHKAVSMWSTAVPHAAESSGDPGPGPKPAPLEDQLKNKYNHPRYFNSCLFALSEVLLQKLLAAIALSPYYSIMMDSSTDISGEDHILIYVQYVNMVSFVPVVQYLCTVSVKPKTADAIFACLMNVLEVLGLPLSKLVGFCSDGGSEYSGRVNGVAAQLKTKVCEYMIVSHCAAHKTALVMTDQAKPSQNPDDQGEGFQDDRQVFDGDASFNLKIVDNIIRAAHGLFAHSSKRLRQWCTYAAPFGVTRFKFQVFNATRWYSRYVCLQVLVVNLVVFMGFLKSHQEGWQAAQQLLVWLRNPNTLALLFVMHDIMIIMNKMSVSFQSATMLPHHVKPIVNETKDALHACVVMNDDGSLQYDAKQLPTFAGFVSSYKYRNGVGSWATSRKGKPLMVYFEPGEDLKLHACLQFTYNLCTSIVRSICARFQNMGVLDAFKIFDPSHYAGYSKSAVQQDSFGQAEFLVLTTHFARASLKRPLFSVPADVPYSITKPDGTVKTGVTSGLRQLREEFKNFKSVMYCHVKDNTGCSMADAWVALYPECSRKYPNVTALAIMSLALPTNTAVVERGFTFHGWFKNEYSNCMRLVTLDSKMRVKLSLNEDCDFMNIDLINPACDVLIASGLSNEQKPPLLSVLYQTACGVQVPRDFVEAFEGKDPCSGYAVLQLGSDDDTDSLQYDPEADFSSSSDGGSSDESSSSSGDSSDRHDNTESDDERAWREAMGM